MPMFDSGLVVRIRHFPAPRAGSQAAARATEAARVLGGEAAFDAARTAIVAEGWDAFADDGARVLAERLGLDPGSFARAMHGDEVDAIVRADVALGESLDISATPTLFLDGRRVDEIIDGPVFWQAAAGDAP
jgi:predicted DsbA family dithiol-disulfide isomerase